jgi:hypothetical protein
MRYRQQRHASDTIMNSLLSAFDVDVAMASGTIHCACVDETFERTHANVERSCVAAIVELDPVRRIVTRIFMRVVPSASKRHVCDNFANRLLAFHADIFTDGGSHYLHGFDGLLATLHMNNHNAFQWALPHGASSNPVEGMFAAWTRFRKQFFGCIPRDDDHLNGMLAMFCMKYNAGGAWGYLLRRFTTTVFRPSAHDAETALAVRTSEQRTRQMERFTLRHATAIAHLGAARRAMNPAVRVRDPLARRGGRFHGHQRAAAAEVLAQQAAHQQAAEQQQRDAAAHEEERRIAQPQPGGPRRESTPDVQCSRCTNLVSRHPSKSCVDCARCGGWTGYECTGLTQQQLAGVKPNRPATWWYCPPCQGCVWPRLAQPVAYIIDNAADA